MTFQHTAARRRLDVHDKLFQNFYCCFNTQPPEGGWSLNEAFIANDMVFQHTAARRRLAKHRLFNNLLHLFQHTAARRRLGHDLVTH